MALSSPACWWEPSRPRPAFLVLQPDASLGKGNCRIAGGEQHSRGARAGLRAARRWPGAHWAGTPQQSRELPEWICGRIHPGLQPLPSSHPCRLLAAKALCPGTAARAGAACPALAGDAGCRATVFMHRFVAVMCFW